MGLSREGQQKALRACKEYCDLIIPVIYIANYLPPSHVRATPYFSDTCKLVHVFDVRPFVGYDAMARPYASSHNVMNWLRTRVHMLFAGSSYKLPRPRLNCR